MSGSSPRVLIAHADGEADRAAELATPLRQAGYDVVHQGTLLVGQSLAEEASRALVNGSPIVICGTVGAVGTGWAHRIVHAARHHPHCLILPVRMDRSAYLEILDWGTSIAEHWQDPALAAARLCAALAARYPSVTRSDVRPDELAAEERYRSLMLANYDIYDWSGLPQRDIRLTSSKLELRRLYVGLRVIVESSTDTGLDPGRLDMMEYEREEQRGTWASHRARHGVLFSPELLRARFALGERLAASRRLVVLGDPGSGKSTLLKWIATAYLLRLRRDPDWQDLPDVSTLPDTDLLPIMIRCRELSHGQAALTFDDVLHHTLHKLVLARDLPDIVHDVLLRRLANGSALLLIDGLDEINDPGVRTAFCDQVERIHTAYPEAPIIVTSRIVGYREMGRRIGRGFEHVRVADLDRSDKEELARRWCALTEPPNRVEQAAAGLVEDIHSSDRIERLTGNPLLLTTMAMVRRYLGRLPNRRGDLYAEAIQVLLNWRPDIGEALSSAEALPQLEYIAYTMCQRRVQRFRLDELADLCDRMRREFPNIHAVGRHDPETFIRLVEQRTGLLNETGYERHQGQLVGVFEFRHLTFQEYLAGLALARGHYPGHLAGQTVAAAVAPLAGPIPEVDAARRLVVPESWREPIRLCATACNSSDVDAVLEAVLVPGDDEPAAASRPRAILSALCLADEPDASVRVARHIVQTLIESIDERDGRRAWGTAEFDERLPPPSDLEGAAAEVASSQWRQMLEDALVREYAAQPPIDRILVGAVLGRVLAGGRKSEWTAAAWAEDLCRHLEHPDDGERIKGALAVGGSVENVELVRMYHRVGIARRLIALCDSTSPVADAAAWALMRSAPQYELFWERQYPPPGYYGWESGWLLSRADLAHLSRALEDGHRRLGPGALFGLYGIAREECLHSAGPSARVTIEDPDARLRAASVHVLGSLADYQSVPLLEELCSSDKDTGVRAAAVRALGWMEPTGALRTLISALDDPAADVVRAAVAAIGYMGGGDAVWVSDAISPLVEKLSASDPSVRRQAAIALGDLEERTAVERLSALLRDPDWTVRSSAIGALRRIGGDSEGLAVLELLEDPEARVRRAAVYAAAMLLAPGEGDTATERLAHHLADSNTDVRRAAVRALAPFAAGPFVAEFRARLADETSYIRAMALRALALQDEPIQIEDAFKHLGSDDDNEVAAAAEALVAAGSADAAHRLVGMCEQLPSAGRLEMAAALHAWLARNHRSPDGRDELEKLLVVHRTSETAALRNASIIGFCLLGDPSTVDDMAQIDRDCDWNAEIQVRRAIGCFGGEVGLAALGGLTGSDSAWTRYVVATRLMVIDGDGVLSVLVTLAGDHNAVVRRRALDGLGRFRDDDDATRMLIAALDDPHWGVRRKAAHLLQDQRQESVTRALMGHRRDRHPWARRQVLQSLGGRPSRLVTSALLDGLRDACTPVRFKAAHALGRTEQKPSLTDRFLGMVSAPDRDERTIGILALPLRQHPRLCEQVVPCLDDVDAVVGKAALQALDAVDHPAAKTRLRSHLRSPLLRFRAGAVYLLKEGRDDVDAVLLSEDLDGEYPDRDPRLPISLGMVRLAAFRLMRPIDEVKRRYEVLAPVFDLRLTWLPAQGG